MNRYRPVEAVIKGVRRCGLYVDVEAQGEVEDVIEMRLEDSPAARVMSDTGEGLYIADGESTPVLNLTGFAAKIACDQCGACPPEDYSIAMDSTKRIDEANVAGLEARYAETVFDIANARSTVLRCILTQPRL
jgi:hypothetical protein